MTTAAVEASVVSTAEVVATEVAAARSPDPDNDEFKDDASSISFAFDSDFPTVEKSRDGSDSVIIVFVGVIEGVFLVVIVFFLVLTDEAVPKPRQVNEGGNNVASAAASAAIFAATSVSAATLENGGGDGSPHS